jgi:hypothetical protein
MDMLTLGIRGNLYHARSFGNLVTAKESILTCHECKPQSTLLSESWKGNMGAHASHPDELSIKRSHCSGNEKNKL